jgi:hypothetical protein
VAKATKRLQRRISRVDQAIKAFGANAKFMRAFQRDSLVTWHRFVPPGHHLGLYVGLERRGYQVSPKLFGLPSWRELPGVRHER